MDIAVNLLRTAASRQAFDLGLGGTLSIQATRSSSNRKSKEGFRKRDEGKSKTPEKGCYPGKKAREQREMHILWQKWTKVCISKRRPQRAINSVHADASHASISAVTNKQMVEVVVTTPQPGLNKDVWFLPDT